ncbi:MAG: PKD domain-containing protein [Bacteroidia bacterium]|nr:PKD domain-containing protein [Bacteroidia bacterium]
MNITKFTSLLCLVLLFSAGSLFAQCSVTYTYSVSGNTVNFTSFPVNASNLYYNWNFGDGQYGYNPNPTHAYAANGYYGVCLTIHDSVSNCYASYCDTIQITGATGGCVANFNVYHYFNGSTINHVFTNWSTGNYTNRYWDFGDGSTGTGSGYIHTYPGAGTYTACLTIWNSTTCADTICQQVVVPGVPASCNAQFTWSGTSLGKNFTNTSASGPVTSILWDFGDGGTGIGNSVSHNFPAAGSYNVCMILNTSNCSDTICHTVNVAGCSANFNSTVTGANGNVNFTNSSSTGSSPVYSWDFGDGGSSSLTNPSHVYANPGTYNVCLSFLDATGCSATVCKNVTVTLGSTSCTANFSFSVSSFQATFTNSSQGPWTVSSWDFGDGATSSLNSPTHTYAAAGTFTVCLVVSGSGSCVDTICKSVTVVQTGNLCQAGFTYTMSGNSLTATNTSTGSFTTSHWDFGDGSTSNSTNGSHNYLTNGYFMVCLTVSDPNTNCSDTWCDTVYAPNNPMGQCNAAFIHYPDTTGQYGIIVVNQSTGVNPGYFWTFGDGNVSNQAYPQHTYASAGTYVLCLRVFDSPCADSICDTITVTQKVASSLTINVISPAMGVEDPGSGPEIQVYPNPFTGAFKVNLNLDQADEVKADLFDLSGKSIRNIFAGTLPGGRSKLDFEAGDLTPGVYFLRISAGGKTSVVKVLKSR